MWDLFKDKNEINEKNIIGFASFILMVMFAITNPIPTNVLILNTKPVSSFNSLAIFYILLYCYIITYFLLYLTPPIVILRY